MSFLSSFVLSCLLTAVLGEYSCYRVCICEPQEVTCQISSAAEARRVLTTLRAERLAYTPGLVVFVGDVRCVFPDAADFIVVRCHRPTAAPTLAAAKLPVRRNPTTIAATTAEPPTDAATMAGVSSTSAPVITHQVSVVGWDVTITLTVVSSALGILAFALSIRYGRRLLLFYRRQWRPQQQSSAVETLGCAL